LSEKDWIRLVAKYRGKCSQCGREIEQGEYALWSRAEKSIKHQRCEALQATGERKDVKPAEELDCFVCGKSAGCGDCSFESDCNRSVVSQACICGSCMADTSAYHNYQEAFLSKMRKVAKVKI
jgi:hypothetical protein